VSEAPGWAVSVGVEFVSPESAVVGAPSPAESDASVPMCVEAAVGLNASNAGDGGCPLASPSSDATEFPSASDAPPLDASEFTPACETQQEDI